MELIQVLCDLLPMQCSLDSQVEAVHRMCNSLVRRKVQAGDFKVGLFNLFKFLSLDESCPS